MDPRGEYWTAAVRLPGSPLLVLLSDSGVPDELSPISWFHYELYAEKLHHNKEAFFHHTPDVEGHTSLVVMNSRVALAPGVHRHRPLFVFSTR